MATMQYEFVRLAKTPTSFEFSNCLELEDGFEIGRGRGDLLVLGPPWLQLIW